MNLQPMEEEEEEGEDEARAHNHDCPFAEFQDEQSHAWVAPVEREPGPVCLD